MRTVSKRNRGVEPKVWPGVHEKWRILGWFTSQYWRVERIGFIVLGSPRPALYGCELVEAGAGNRRWRRECFRFRF